MVGQLPDGAAHEVDRVEDANLTEIAAVCQHRQSLIHGHVPAGCGDALGVSEATYLTVLREPVSRVISAYNYLQGFPDEHLTDGERVAKALSLSASIEAGVSHNYDNQQVRQLSGVYLSTPIGTVGRSEFDAAVEAVRTMRFVGTTEHLSALQREIANEMGWSMPELPRLNRSSASPGSDLDDPEVADLVRESNRWDIELYRLVLEEIAITS